MATPCLEVEESARLDFPEYVAQRRPALLRAAHAIAGDPHTAEDLLQTALVAVGDRWHAIRDPRAADAYVRRAMVNRMTSWHRQAWRRRERPTELLPEPATSVQDEPGDADPRLWGLVLELPPRQRAAIALRYYEQLSEAETAAVLGCSVGTVKSSTSRGVAALRRRLAA